MAKKTVEQIVREQKPGYRVAAQPKRAMAAPEAHDAPTVDAASHSLSELKRKYLGANTGLDEAVAAAAPKTMGNDELEIVAIEPETPDDTPNSPPHRAKAAIVSRTTGRIIGEQG
jgi:hypothetical protein